MNIHPHHFEGLKTIAQRLEQLRADHELQTPSHPINYRLFVIDPLEHVGESHWEDKTEPPESEK